MKLKIVIGVVVVLAVAAVLGAIKFQQIHTLIEMGKHMPQQVETISSAIVKEENWQGTLSAVGSVTAVQGVNVTTELAGTVKEIAFESGGMVAKDALLIRLDTSTEEAQLRSTEAQVEWARISAERARTLRKDGTVSQSELDSAEAGLKQNQANTDAIKAAIAKKTIRAPFAGQLGIRQVNLGEYLDTGKPVVSLQSLAPVHAEFSIPQQNLAQLKTGMKVRLTTDAFPGRSFDGTLTAINPDLDVNTRSVRLQAKFENADQTLRPGMFAKAEVLLPQDQKVMVIPSTSVLSKPYGSSVFVVENSTNQSGGLVVQERFIKTGATRGDFISVHDGLKPGEKIANAGLIKLRSGMAVTENNSMVPKATEAPRPPDA
jgi:membrane fusion protein (multidrug efflux system)